MLPTAAAFKLTVVLYFPPPMRLFYSYSTVVLSSYVSPVLAGNATTVTLTFFSTVLFSLSYAVQHAAARFIGFSVFGSRNQCQANAHGLRTVQRTAYPTQPLIPPRRALVGRPDPLGSVFGFFLTSLANFSSIMG